MKKGVGKRYFFLACTLIVVLLGWIWVLDSDGGGLWPNKQGELCWATTRDGDSEPSGMVRLGINNLNGGHYVVAGVAIGTDGSGNPYVHVVQGSAEFIQWPFKSDPAAPIEYLSKLMITVVGSERDGIAKAFRSAIRNVMLDPSTLDGDYQSIGWENFQITPTIIEEELEKGSLTLRDCP